MMINVVLWVVMGVTVMSVVLFTVREGGTEVSDGSGVDSGC